LIDCHAEFSIAPEVILTISVMRAMDTRDIQ
jgi:hypothetical protein